MIGRLLGVKVIDEGDGYKVIRFPMWASESVIQRVVENLRRDAAALDTEIRVTVGHRNVRFETVASAMPLDFGGPTVGHCSKCGEARDAFYSCRDGGRTVPIEEAPAR